MGMTLAILLLAIAVPPAVAQTSDAAVTTILASNSGSALAAVRKARTGSQFVSSLSETELDTHLARLLQWVVRSYGASGSLRLLSDAPEATNGRGEANARLGVLKETYWLQDNALYGAGALKEYVPALGQYLENSWRTKWAQTFPKFCPDTQSGYVVGIVPAYDGNSTPSDPRCRLSRPGDWQYFRMNQYPSPKDPNFDTLPRPIIGTDYPADENGQTQFAAIRKNSVRDLLKYGCLRQVMLGNSETAGHMFEAAFGQWDGNGFRNAKSGKNSASLQGIYWTRDLAFALMCANALGVGSEGSWAGVSKSSIEQKLWASQSSTGGIWSNYCSGDNCGGDFIPGIAKQTNEIAPLVLLAYGPNIWHRVR